MKVVDIVSSLDKALVNGEITPSEWAEKKRGEIEKDIKKRFPLPRKHKERR